MTYIAGVDGCRAGWIAAFMEVGVPDSLVMRVAATFAVIVDAPEAPALVAVDMPIGLPETIEGSGRGPEQLVRPLLGARQSSVFAIPARAAVYASQARAGSLAGHLAGHRLASEAALATSTPPRKVSIQAFGIFPKIREIDALLRTRADLAARVREIHPEVAFWAMNGRRPLTFPKKVRGEPAAPGLAERARLLALNGIPTRVLAGPPPKGAGADDRLDALAALVVAREIAAGRGVSFPDPPGRDAHGLPVAIWCFAPETG